MKKIITFMLVLIMLFSLAVTAFADTAGFTDISKSDYKKAIEKMYDLGVVNGYTQTRFGPDYALSRAHAAQIFVNALYSEDDIKRTVINFKDVDSNQWYFNAVNAAYYYNLIHGMGNGYFCPNDDVSYDQFTAMLLNALGYEVTELDGVWPTNVQELAKDLDLYDELGRIFDSSAAITRAEACQMFYNALDLDMVTLKRGKFVSTGETLYEAMGFEYKTETTTRPTYPPTRPVTRPTFPSHPEKPEESNSNSLSVLYAYSYTFGDGYVGFRIIVDNENGTYTEYKTAGTVAAEYVIGGETYKDIDLYYADYDEVDLHAGDEVFLELTYPGSGVYKIVKVVCHHGDDGITTWPDASIPVDQPGQPGPGSTDEGSTLPGGFLVP